MAGGLIHWGKDAVGFVAKATVLAGVTATVAVGALYTAEYLENTDLTSAQFDIGLHDAWADVQQSASGVWADVQSWFTTNAPRFSSFVASGADMAQKGWDILTDNIITDAVKDFFAEGNPGDQALDKIADTYENAKADKWEAGISAGAGAAAGYAAHKAMGKEKVKFVERVRQPASSHRDTALAERLAAAKASINRG
jgi:hypothetical protein